MATKKVSTKKAATVATSKKASSKKQSDAKKKVVAATKKVSTKKAATVAASKKATQPKKSADKAKKAAVKATGRNFTIANDVVKREIVYIVDKLMDAKKDKKNVCNHFAVLYGATLDYLTKGGIKFEPVGNHGYKFHVPNNGTKALNFLEKIYGDKNPEDGYTADEVKYLIEKIKLGAASTRKKNHPDKVTYYGYLSKKSTLKEFANIGITFEPRGSHGYAFTIPDKKSGAWRKMLMYGSKRDGKGHSIKEAPITLPSFDEKKAVATKKPTTDTAEAAPKTDNKPKANLPAPVEKKVVEKPTESPKAVAENNEAAPKEEKAVAVA